MSRKAIRLGDGALAALERDFNNMIVRAIDGMKVRDADESTVTVKLSILFEKENFVEPDGNIESVIRPKFEHKITSAIHIKDKLNGQFETAGTLDWDPVKKQYTVDVEDDQLHLDTEEF